LLLENSEILSEAIFRPRIAYGFQILAKVGRRSNLAGMASGVLTELGNGPAITLLYRCSKKGGVDD